MLRVYCVYHELRRTGMRGVDGTRAPIKPDVVFSSTALRAASPDGGLNELRHPGCPGDEQEHSQIGSKNTSKLRPAGPFQWNPASQERSNNAAGSVQAVKWPSGPSFASVFTDR